MFGTPDRNCSMAPVTRTQSARTANSSTLPSQFGNTPANPPRQRRRSERSVREFATSIHPQADTPPNYRIDLSLPPRQRYKDLANDYRHEMESLVALFDPLLEEFTGLGRFYRRSIQKLSGLLLRRVYSQEETEELRGIHEVTGIDMYLLVAFNVVLDCLMGCTSGGVRVRAGSSGSRMMHFRTLDWGMDPLRSVIVQLEFVNGPEGQVIARSVGYVGFVGILTGVR